MKNKQNFLKELKAYPSDQYSDIRLYELVTIGILRLNQSKLETNFENITVILLRLFPDKFSLTYFPEFPDTIRVDNTLRLDCKHMGVVKGNRPKGFVLTGKGQILGEKILQKIESGSGKVKSSANFSRNRFIKLVKGVTESSGYKKFVSKNLKEIKKFDVCESLHCTMNADEVHLRENLGTLTSHAIQTEKIPDYKQVSKSVLSYLQFIESNWDELVNE